MSHPTARPTSKPLAFMDESESDRKADPDTYLLAVTLVQPQTLDPIRATMPSLRAPGQRKLHWHSESPRRRAFVIEHVAALDAQHLIVVRDGRPGETSERRRLTGLEAGRQRGRLPGAICPTDASIAS
jgi:hypothetical protein